VWLRRLRIERRRSRLPAPQPVQGSGPQRAVAIGIQADDAGARAAGAAMALHAVVASLAECPTAAIERRHPDSAVTVLDKLANTTTLGLDVLHEPSGLERGQALVGPNPQRAVARGQQARDHVGR